MITDMKRIAVTISVFFLLLMPAIAQSPGYCGKKFLISYTPSFSSALSNPNYNGNKGFMVFNLHHLGGVDYVVGRKAMLGISVRYFRTAFYYKASFNYDMPGSFETARFNGDYPSNPFSGKKPLTGKMKVLAIGIAPRIFTSSGIAPVGAYIRPEVLLSFYSVGEPSEEDILDYVSQKARDANVLPEFRNAGPYMKLGLGVELGATRVFLKRWVLDYGIRGGLTLGSMNRGPFEEAITEDNIHEILLSNRLMKTCLLTFKAGIGFLAF